jgi:hypothetical protein
MREKGDALLWKSKTKTTLGQFKLVNGAIIIHCNLAFECHNKRIVVMNGHYSPFRDLTRHCLQLYINVKIYTYFIAMWHFAISNLTGK